MKDLGLVLAAALALGSPAHAEVVETGTQGFRLAIVQKVAATPAKVYAALGEIGRWWNDAHTYFRQSGEHERTLAAWRVLL